MFRKAIHYLLYTVKSIDDLPPAIGATLQQVQPDDAIRALVVIPPQEYPIHRFARFKMLPFGFRRTPQRTLAFTDDHTAVVEAYPDNTLNTIVIPIETLVKIDFAVILLYAYVQFSWVEAGQMETAKIEFNAVGEHVLYQQVSRIRRLIADESQPVSVPMDTMPTLQAITADFPFKFQSYLKYSLLPEEQVVAAVYQPAVRKAERRFWPFLSPNRAIAITTQHVIMLEEEEKKATSHYGVITRFCPLRSVQGVDFETDADAEWMRLVVGIGEASEEMRMPLAAANAAVLREGLKRVTAGLHMPG